MIKYPRNAKCPCGSGRKFKKCHGAPPTEEQKKRFATLVSAFATLPSKTNKAAENTIGFKPRKKGFVQQVIDRVATCWKNHQKRRANG